MFLGRFKLFRYSTKGDAKLAELVPLSHKIAKQSRIGIFRNELHPIHSIGLKSHVLGPFRPFRYSTKVNAKLAELVPLTHKFAKQSRVQIFPNERTRSTPLDPKVIFLGRFGPFVTARKSMQNWPNWCHYCTSSPKQSRVAIFRNERTRSTPLDPKLMF
jgi:hypothetical protein